MQEIAEWLKKLGMSEYAERFTENAIDFSVLPDLTDQDREKPAFLLGHRRTSRSVSIVRRQMRMTRRWLKE